MQFETLYKKNKNGSIQYWSIIVDGNKIVTQYGQVDGKSQMTEDVIKDGKNIGRSNATTPETQAMAEALSRWEKQIKKGYTNNIHRAKKGEHEIGTGIDPMLAHSFAKHGHKIKYPAYMQPKLDGIRCIAMIGNGKCSLYSRTRKPITSMPHIIRELELLYPDGLHILDGELYNHDFKNNFEHIVSLVRQEEPAESHTDVQYHVYDRAGCSGGFNERIVTINRIRNLNLKYIKGVETAEVASEDLVMDWFNTFRNEGYEGAMIRNAHDTYENRRSYSLQKIKEFDDAEFQIIGIEEGRGKLTGHVGAFVCKTKEGKEFLAKMSGDTDNLRRYFNDQSLWQGKFLTVQYQGLTGANGVPRFPVGIKIKDPIEG